jgi:trimethylamine---corrinoid protein Co-methyltransferase
MKMHAIPECSMLTKEQRELIHRNVTHILSDIGMRVLHPEAGYLLREAGCGVKEGGIYTIPPEILERSVSGAPSRITVCNRCGEPCMELGGEESYFGTGSDLMYFIDSRTLERRPCVLEDARNAARLGDALDQIDFIMSFAYPSDEEPHRAFLMTFRAMLENSVKPIVCTSHNTLDLKAMWDMASVLRGGSERLSSAPYIIHYTEPTSPLTHSFESLAKLLFCADHRIPLVYSPAPLAGATAPVTVAGHVSQGLAECLCGLVIHQLRTPGAPFIVGMGPAVMDMATAQSSYNAPEYYLAYMAALDMSRFYGLPSWGYAGTTDSQIPDGQAVMEASVLTLLSSLWRAGLNHDVGYHDFGLAGSFELVVIMNEVIAMARRFSRGFPLDEEELAAGPISEVGPAGNYLVHPHTLAHFRTSQWRPELLNRAGYDRWKQGGKKNLLDRAREKVEAILSGHIAESLPASTISKLDEITARFDGS